MRLNKQLASSTGIRLLAVALLIFTAGPRFALPSRADESVTAKVGAAAAQAETKLQDTRESAKTKLHQLWERIDEKRLKNRTPDELIAWVIMGLLVGGLIQKFSRRKWPVTLVLGLVGAFIGGIVANLVEFNLGLGPVLIRYEELMASLVGGILIVLAARLLTPAKSKPE